MSLQIYYNINALRIQALKRLTFVSGLQTAYESLSLAGKESLQDSNQLAQMETLLIQLEGHLVTALTDRIHSVYYIDKQLSNLLIFMKSTGKGFYR